MEKIFEQIPESKIVTDKIEREIGNFIEKISNIIIQKKSERIEVELTKNEIDIVTGKFKQEIENGFKNKGWNIQIETKKKMEGVQWDMYEVEYKKMIISVIN